MIRCFAFLLAALAGAMCCGGSSTVVEPPYQPPPPQVFILEISGSQLSYVGGQSHIIAAIRAIESPNPIYWTVNGPGYLAIDAAGKQPLAPGDGRWGWLYFIPPATLPGGVDTTTTVYYTTLDLFNGGMKKSPECVQAIKALKTPMTFESAYANAVQSVPPNVSVNLGARVYPVPFGWDSWASTTWTIKDVNPLQANPGTLVVNPIQNDYRGSYAIYTSPATVTQSFDVTITATTHDPWFNLDPVLTWVVHVTKGP